VALGLDTIKADYLCDAAARRFGGIVAPTQGYQIHESGFHGPWLEEVVGEQDAMLAGLMPQAVLYPFLYQLRAFANAGFRAVFVLTGHAGGNQEDLRWAGALFERATGLRVSVCADPELVEGKHQGDHAGRYEVSQLMAIRPDLVSFDHFVGESIGTPEGRLAQGFDAFKATVENGERILEDCLVKMGLRIDSLMKSLEGASRLPCVPPSTVEAVWSELWSNRWNWRSVQQDSESKTVNGGSQWRAAFVDPFGEGDSVPKVFRGAARRRRP
jgi:creatinine amidohydrolase